MNITQLYTEENIMYTAYYTNLILEDINYFLVGFILFYIM